MLATNVTDSLERQEMMLDIVGNSIKKVGKKLHKLELMMHNEPSEDAEVRDKLAWHDKMEKLLHHDVTKRLPTLREVKIARYQKQQSTLRKTGHKSMTLLDNLKRPGTRTTLPDKSMKALKEARANRKPGPSIELGSSNKPGRIIRVIKNYSGVNTSYGKDRTLVSKDGRCGKSENPTSSLPEWFGPGYYPDADRALMATRLGRPPSGSLQLPFKSTGRTHEPDMSSTVRKRELEQQALLRSVADAARDMIYGDEAFDDSKNLYRSSTSRSYTTSRSGHSRPSHKSRRKPRYCSPSSCSRPHSQLEKSDMENSLNPWSSSSARSTIGQPISQSGLASPPTVIMSPCNSSNKDGLIYYDDVMLSEFMDSDSVRSNSQSSHHSRATTGTGMLSTSSVDSVLLKGVKRDKAKFKIHDYTMGALDMQDSVPLYIPEPDEVELAETHSTANRFAGSKEPDLRAKYAVTSVDSEQYSASAERERSRRSRHRRRHASRAAAVLEDVRSDLLTAKSSHVLDADIPFSESMDSYVDMWRSQRNLVSAKLLRPKSSGPRDPAPHVDFSQLLMDDSELGGLSAEESQTLLSQYTDEFSAELGFL